MYLDAFTLAALTDEFMDIIVGGKIQDAIDVDNTALGLEIYQHRQRHYLYLSADKQVPRVHLVADKLRRGVQKPTQLGLLFRRYVENGRVVHVHQPTWERILHIEVAGPEGEVVIIIEPMERRSNLLLVRDDIILDCMWRVGPEDNRYRVSLPNQPYTPPPPMTDRLDPTRLALADVEGLLASCEDPKDKVVRLLTRKLYGVSPLLGREICYRAVGEANPKVGAVTAAALFEALQTIMPALADRAWQPGVAEDDGLIEAYSVYPLTHLAGWRTTPTLSAAMSAYYGGAVGADAYNRAKQPVREAIAEGRKKFGAKLASLERGLKDDSEREQLQQSGELILAYQYSIAAGQTELRAQYDPEGPELVVALDPDKTPLENAQRYFDRYNRAKRAQQGVPQLIAEARNELAYLDQLENDLETASNWPEIDDVIQALQARGLMQNKQIKRIGGGGRSGPMKLTRDGYVIYVGRNSRQNEQVTFKLANKQDMWLHARDVPGAHVVIRDDGRRIPDDLIERAAAVAAHYSTLRGESAVIVDVTRIKYVKAIKGAGPGMVTYRNEETVTVAPHDESILQEA